MNDKNEYYNTNVCVYLPKNCIVRTTVFVFFFFGRLFLGLFFFLLSLLLFVFLCTFTGKKKAKNSKKKAKNSAKPLWNGASGRQNKHFRIKHVFARWYLLGNWKPDRLSLSPPGSTNKRVARCPMTNYLDVHETQKRKTSENSPFFPNAYVRKLPRPLHI